MKNKEQQIKFRPNYLIDEITEKIYVGKLVFPDGKKEDFYITKEQHEEILKKINRYICYGEKLDESKN